MTWPNDSSKAAIRARNAWNTLVSTCQTSHALVRVCTIGAGDGCCGGCRTVVSRRAFNRIGCFALAVITCWTGIATGLTGIVLVVTWFTLFWICTSPRTKMCLRTQKCRRFGHISSRALRTVVPRRTWSSNK